MSTVANQPSRERWLDRPVLFWTLFGLLSVGALWPLLGYQLIPGADYPAHLTILGLLKYRFSDPESFGAVFGTRLLQPYWGFYLPVLVLSVVIPLELAAKLVLGAALLAIPWSIYRIAVREGFDPRTALAAFLLTYGFSYYWGFAPFVVATSLGLVGLTVSLRFARENSGRALLALTLTSLGLFAAHAMAWALWMALTFWLVLTETWRPRVGDLLRAASSAVLPLILFQIWREYIQGQRHVEHLRDQLGHRSFHTRLGAFTGEAFSGASVVTQSLYLGSFLACVFLSMNGDHGPAWHRRLVRWGGLAAVMFIAYWTLPQDVAGFGFLHQRLLPFAFLFLLPCAAKRMRVPSVFIALASSAALLFFGEQAFIAKVFNREVQGASECLKQARPGSSVLGLLALRRPLAFQTEGFSFRYPLFLHVDNYHSYWNKGRVFGHWDTLQATPVYWRVTIPDDKKPAPLVAEFPQTFSYETMSSKVDYFLFHSPKYTRGASDNAPMLVDSMYLGSGVRQVRAVCEVGSWRLYEHLHSP